MRNIINKILIGVSLATTIALAIPLSFMTASIVRGESPRQVAESEPASDIVEDIPIENEPSQDPEYMKPVVPPTPEPEQEIVPEPDPEPVAQIAETPAPAPKTSNRPTNTKTTTKTTPSAQKSTQSNTGLPKAELAPGEAPCMVDGLDGYSYDYSAASQPAPEPVAAPVQQNTPQLQESTTTNAGNAANSGYSVPPSELDGSTIVYVSNRSSTIHSIHYCSGMKNYREMTKADAESHGYAYCKDCW